MSHNMLFQENCPVPMFRALMNIRAKQGGRDPMFLDSWTPLHDLMDCISITYQVAFENLQTFIRSRSEVLQAMVGQ